MKTAGILASVLVTAFLAGCGSTGTAGSGDGARYKAVAGQGGVYDLQFPPDTPVAAMRNTDAQDPDGPGGGDGGPDWNPGADYLKKPGRHYGMQAN